ncbi:hypothetical protein L6452_06290 [Arctium lappa]|uniref:Uncharacterized protein n=1 Tax=Arctium lappa TaxID=4217 RepID=A0ACB9EIG8_ARCLA|nr:hypothetical protein L6452_06290 [Arctium lappa]
MFLDPKLLFIGSCRNDAGEIEGILGGATADIHSMIDENFGISVLEYMAAGAIPIAGSKMDIMSPEEGKQTGFLAETIK